MKLRGLRKAGSIAAVLVTLGALLTACHPAGSVIVGSVLLTNGDAAGHVEVAAYASTADSEPTAQTSTNVSGDFALNKTDLPDGGYFVRIGDGWWTGSALSTDAGDATAVTVDASGSPITIDAQVDIGATLTGVLVDAHDDPLAGQPVLVETLDADLVAFAPTDATGTFTIALAMPGEYRVALIDPSTDDLTTIGQLSYTLSQGQTLDVGTLSIYTTPTPMRLVGTRNFVGGVAAPYVGQPGLIRSDMNPGYWAAIEAPGTAVSNGDLISTQCIVASSGACSPPGLNPAYDPNGQFYTLQIDAATPYLMLQGFDAGFDARTSQLTEAGDSKFAAASGTWTTNYQLLAPDATPNDPTDNPVVASATCGGGAGNADNSGGWHIVNNDDSNTASAFKNKWRTLCTLTNPAVTAAGAPYVLRVWSSAPGIQGNAVNRFALRAVGATTPDVDATGYPTAPVADSAQPALAARSRATVAAVYPGGRSMYPLVQVGPQHAGHTLVLDLFDVADGAVPRVTVNAPYGPQQGCFHTTKKLDGSEKGSALIPATTSCTVQTSPSGTTLYNGVTLSIQIPIPESYSCDVAERPNPIDASFAGNGCWWSLTYDTTSSQYDITTWTAHVL